MSKIVLLVAVILIIWGAIGRPVFAQEPPRPGQPHTDIFPCPGCQLQDVNQDGVRDMQDLSPVSIKAASARTVSYRLITMPGCTTGTIPQAMQRVEAELQSTVNFRLVRNDITYDLTVRINCGSEQIRICGAVTIFCLGRGFPYNNDIELSDILSTYTPESQLSIPLHEVLHALGVWNEQYCTGSEAPGTSCYGQPRFNPAPNWRDVMNTGPLSRHGMEGIEIERWERTLYVLAPTSCPGPPNSDNMRWDACADNHEGGKGLWISFGNWDFNPGSTSSIGPITYTGQWYDKQGNSEWGPETTYRDDNGVIVGWAKWNIRTASWHAYFVRPCYWTEDTGWLNPAGAPC